MEAFKEQVFSLSDNIIFHAVNEKKYIILADTLSEDSIYYKVNGISALYILALDGQKTITDITTKISKDTNSETSPNELASLVEPFFQKLISKNIILEHK